LLEVLCKERRDTIAIAKRGEYQSEKKKPKKITDYTGA